MLIAHHIHICVYTAICMHASLANSSYSLYIVTNDIIPVCIRMRSTIFSTQNDFLSNHKQACGFEPDGDSILQASGIIVLLFVTMCGLIF